MNVPKKKAIQFVQKYKLKKNSLTCETMKDILRRQGFLLFRHNKFGRSSDKVEAVLKSLQLTEYAVGKEGFVYASSTDKAVFTNCHLGEDEELYVLLHEEGHIACNHPVQHGVLAYNDVLCEQEANTFAFYVMQYLTRRKLRGFVYAVCALLLAVGIGFAAHAPSSSSALTADSHPAPSSFRFETVQIKTPNPADLSLAESGNTIVYVAKTGTVYHKETCSYISGHSGVREMNIDTAEKLDLPPCSRCRPDIVQ